jgi:hypothetical protein
MGGADARSDGSVQVAGYLIVAAVAFILGLLLANPDASRAGSRIDWPHRTVPHPRTIGP